MTELRLSQKTLPILERDNPHEFIDPVKRINDGEDVSFFLTSTAYRDLWSFIFQLNASMFPRRSSSDGGSIQSWELDDTNISLSPTVANLKKLLEELGNVIAEAPPDTGPRRFGNISFRRWHEIVESRLPALMQQYLPHEVLEYRVKAGSGATAKDELKAYLSGSFGSSQRLDYGTGHELSFIAFLACIWKLGGFQKSANGEEERGIVTGVVEPYLKLIRKLILTYTLEPAGSHGVWGLDDHFFIPYIFGSAQLSPPIETPADIATEGSLDGASKPTDVTKATIVDRERQKNMYFSAIGFINDVKKGPFWEHSPILFDITGVKGSWAKINKGLIKMYNVEVLSKFPVVQHFPFGSLFRWERDPEASAATPSVHTVSQPSQPAAKIGANNATAAPWASGSANRAEMPSGTIEGSTRAPWATKPSLPPTGGPSTAAPWARPGGVGSSSSARAPMPPTRAPWASGEQSKR